MSPRSKFKRKFRHSKKGNTGRPVFRLSVTPSRWQTRQVTTSYSKVRVAVIGVGSLGKEHARIYSELAAAGLVEFAGVHDISADHAKKIAPKYNVPPFGSPAEAAAAADAVNIVTPTTTHYDYARALLDQGKHVLV